MKRLAPLMRYGFMRELTRDALLAMDPETAHVLTLNALKLGVAPRPEKPDAPELRTRLGSLDLSNPVGMAAGFDKNGETPAALAAIGFGMVEIGTVTPRPQDGNPKPRLFRIEQAQAVVNRMGFNNDGHEAVYRRLSWQRLDTVLGINIGANKDSSDFVADYVAGVQQFSDIADYLTVNVSSPNTPGLRDLQAGDALKRLLGEVLATRSRQRTRVPIFLKLAPDLDEGALDTVAHRVLESDLDGLVISNTTTGRTGVESLQHAQEAGGLSGRPLFDLSTRRLAQLRLRVGEALPLIGVGGIHSAGSALAKLEAGANAIQLYSALVYGGIGLLDEIKAGLVEAARQRSVPSVADFVGTRVSDWASGRLSLRAIDTRPEH